MEHEPTNHLEGADENLQRHGPTGMLALGQWYWVLPDQTDGTDESKSQPEDPDEVKDWEEEPDARVVTLPNDARKQASGGVPAPQPPHPQAWLGCLIAIGSNYVEIAHPDERGIGSRTRIHFDNFAANLQLEPNAEQVIAEFAQHFRDKSNRCLQQIQAITARLGLNRMPRIADRGVGAQGQGLGGETTRALVVLNGQDNLTSYQLALKQAKDTQLPELYEEMKEHQKDLTRWMMASTLPLLAQTGSLHETVRKVEDRILNVSLYAGLSETVVQCADGKPADAAEKLRIMQRRLYMDEECLANYSAGGMDFRSLKEFDAWLARPENLNRVLPFQRCMVAMRVRRDTKEREWGGSLRALFSVLKLEIADKLTYLYIRNGEQLWRLDTEVEFEEMLFPDKATMNLSEPMMFKRFGWSVEKFITRADYEDRKARMERAEEMQKRWKRENRGQSYFQSPYYRELELLENSEWYPFDSSSVFFDDACAKIEDQVSYYNRIALIVQGLYDRSMALHPHAPVRTWDAAGFDEAIELVYDQSYSLTYGEPPSFEEYRARCNASVSADSYFVGQELAWMTREAERENARLDRNWNARGDYRHKLFQPFGDPGPGCVSKAASIQPRARKVTFRWSRERRTYDRWGINGDPVESSITVALDDLLNVSAYRPGDFKQFFHDPRTRQKYLAWAPLLMAAEDWHAGKTPQSMTRSV